MYVVRKAENYSYGRNKWVDVHVTADPEDAKSFFLSECRLLVESDPNMNRDQIESRMRHCVGYNNGGMLDHRYHKNRYEFQHNGTAFAVLKSTSAKYDGHSGLMRPDRTELLDAILS